MNHTSMNGESDKQAHEESIAKKTITPIHEGRLISLHSESYTTSLGKVHTDIVTHPGAVGIIPIDEKGNIYLIRQWRRAVSKVLIEIPAGTLEPGEDIAVCAQRELQEETGFMAKSLIPLGKIFTCPGFCTEVIFLFLAEKLTPAPLAGDEHEVIDPFPVSLDKALALIDDGTIDDAKTISAIMLYVRHIAKGSSR